MSLRAVIAPLRVPQKRLGNGEVEKTPEPIVLTDHDAEELGRKLKREDKAEEEEQMRTKRKEKDERARGEKRVRWEDDEANAEAERQEAVRARSAVG